MTEKYCPNWARKYTTIKKIYNWHTCKSTWKLLIERGKLFIAREYYQKKKKETELTSSQNWNRIKQTFRTSLHILLYLPSAYFIIMLENFAIYTKLQPPVTLVILSLFYATLNTNPWTGMINTAILLWMWTVTKYYFSVESAYFQIFILSVE